MNAREQLQRHHRFPGCRKRAQLHESRRQAWAIAIRTEPYAARPRGAAWCSPPDPDHAQRGADRSGERLLRSLGPRFEEIDAELAALSELRDKPAGTIRVTATEYAVDTLLWPKLAKFLARYPDIKVEVISESALTDIVTQRFDAGVRIGEQVAKDMIAVRIGPDMRMAVVGAPSYFRRQAEPKKPQDLINHRCINLRLPTQGGLYAWEFEKGARKLKVRVEGPLTFNGSYQNAQCGPGRLRPRLRS